MLTKRGLIEFCLTFPGAYEDYPFDDDPGSAQAWAVLRHRVSKKAFAFIYERGGVVNINLKCDPMYADLLRGAYFAVTPAYHMNKVHWNTVKVDGSVPEQEIYAWIGQSYDLIRPGTAKRKK